MHKTGLAANSRALQIAVLYITYLGVTNPNGHLALSQPNIGRYGLRENNLPMLQVIFDIH